MVQLWNKKIKYLGVVLDSELGVRQQAGSVLSKMSQKQRLLKRIGRDLTIATRCLIL